MTADPLLRPLGGFKPLKRSIFVSYHHSRDRAYYDAFSRLFAESYRVIQDNSVERQIDSDNAEYVIRKIREEYITGSSCTVVLCGAETPRRKFVDWEIKATLDKQHGLIALKVPTNPNFFVPERLMDNVTSGFAVWTGWEQLSANHSLLLTFIEQANARSKILIRNQRELRCRNG
ncbi:MAG: TIR domain-containing protein [Pyrinomonadaceae bacterium]